MRESNTEKYRGFLPLRVALFIVACAALVLLVSWHIRISDKKVELEALRAQIAVQDTRNEEIRKAVKSLENDDGLEEYAEQRARKDLDYAKPGERIFVDVGGGD